MSHERSFPYIVDIDVMDIVPNTYNPNTLSDQEFEMLLDNIDKVGFVDPLLVVPFTDDGTRLYRIVDGEHRWEAARHDGRETVPCVVVDPVLYDEMTMKMQTVRMNKIKGALDVKKFNNLVNDLVNHHGMNYDDVAFELGFADENEFSRLVEETRASLPVAARPEFDKKVKKAETPDDIIRLAERLYKKYGDTLPANFMVFDFGTEHNMMVKIDRQEYSLFLAKFRQCLDAGVTVDSVLVSLLRGIDIDKYVGENKDRLKGIDGSEAEFIEPPQGCSQEEQSTK